MVIGEDRAGQVVGTAAAGVALVAPAVGLGVVPTVLMTSSDEQCGQVTPSGQRIARTVSKHLASSTRSWMFTIVRGLRIRVRGQRRGRGHSTTGADYTDRKADPNPPPRNPS